MPLKPGERFGAILASCLQILLIHYIVCALLKLNAKVVPNDIFKFGGKSLCITSHAKCYCDWCVC